MTFRTQFDQHRDRNGQSCTVVRELDDSERDPEVGQMFRIRFEDGIEIDAWPEELL